MSSETSSRLAQLLVVAAAAAAATAAAMLAAAALRLRSALPRASQLWASAPPLTQHVRDFRTKSRLSRPWKHRIAMLKNMVTSLIVHEKIKTTHAKAKECMRLFDRMVTLAKRGTDPEASRLTQLRMRADASRYVKTKEAYAKLFSVLADRYRARQGGYSSVLKTYPRIGDGAPMSFVSLVDRPMKRMPPPLPLQIPSVYPGRGGRKWRAKKRDMRNEITFQP